jgi:hypothetical protein
MRGATHPRRWLVLAAAWLVAAIMCTPASAQRATEAVLDVPFVPQGEDLCGGAAAAMVMRYWGEAGVHADAFAPLVDRSAGGIRTSALTGELRRRGWTAVEGSGSATDLARELGRRRPVIALIEVRPGRYHYVVVLAAAADTVVVHDSARGPTRVMSTRAFESAWEKSDRWMLILLPGLKAQSGAAETESPGAAPGTRTGVDHGIRLANDGDYVAARRALEAVTVEEPGNAAAWRELAGVDALERKWDAAAEHVRRAVAIDSNDAHAWRVLATAEYVRHHDVAALDAWNRIGEPAIDLVDVKGLQATRYDAVAATMDLAPGRILTPETLKLAERRARDIPSIAAARVTFHPVENGRAQVDAALVEGERAPTRYPSWISIGLDAAANREVAASIASPSGGGDLIAASWRWWDHRPMIAASYAAPGPRALGGGVWRVDVSRETQTFAPGLFEETRTRAGVATSYWLTSRARVGGAAGIESWTDRRRTPSLSGRAEYWPIADRLTLAAGAARWNGFGTADAQIRWRSSVGQSGVVWLAASGYQFATDGAPPSLWPGADTGHARDVLLRAHPLLDAGVITGGAFGRRLAFGNAEIQRWQSAGKWPVRIAPAVFVDVARATRGFDGTSPRTEVDAGAGLRLSLLGMGVLRVDVARGLRDGATALSIGWQR